MLAPVVHHQVGASVVLLAPVEVAEVAEHAVEVAEAAALAATVSSRKLITLDGLLCKLLPWCNQHRTA